MQVFGTFQASCNTGTPNAHPCMSCSPDPAWHIQSGHLFMPAAAPRPCTYPGCGKLVADGTGRCPPHKIAERKQAEQQRGSSAKRGYSYAWQRARAGYLRSHPLCIACDQAGRTVEASVVDHITPHQGDKNLFWDNRNWQSLCKPCHDAKTAREDGGFGNAAR